MQVTQTYDSEKKLLTDIVLNQEDYVELDSGCPDVGYLVGKSERGMEFLILPGDHIGRGFEKFSYSSYSTVMGLPTGYPTRKDNDLKKAINKSKRIPMGTRSGEHLGYVLLRVA
ncbi:MAG: hypothetical protein V3V78_04545 [Candidatus Woesearchaeota archaeon]